MTINYGGVFGELNPKLACADGSYHVALGRVGAAPAQRLQGPVALAFGHAVLKPVQLAHQPRLRSKRAAVMKRGDGARRPSPDDLDVAKRMVLDVTDPA